MENQEGSALSIAGAAFKKLQPSRVYTVFAHITYTSENIKSYTRIKHTHTTPLSFGSLSRRRIMCSGQ